MRQLDLTYRREFTVGGHVELQVHADLDLLAVEVEHVVTDLVLSALGRGSLADRVADAVNAAGEVPPVAVEPAIVHETGDSAGISEEPQSPQPERPQPQPEPEAEPEPVAPAPTPTGADDVEPPFHVEPAVDGHRRVFTRAQKHQAIEYAARVGYAEAGRRLGVHDRQIAKWARTLRPAPLDLQTQTGQERPVNGTVKPAVEVAQKRATVATPPKAERPPAATERDDAGSGAPAPDGKIEAPGDDPAWPFKCSCARRFPTVTDWRDHRKGIPHSNWKLHRLVEQPKAAMVDPGVPRRPPRRAETPDVLIVQSHAKPTYSPAR